MLSRSRYSETRGGDVGGGEERARLGMARSFTISISGA
jgi:hypothetical protein